MEVLDRIVYKVKKRVNIFSKRGVLGEGGALCAPSSTNALVRPPQNTYGNVISIENRIHILFSMVISASLKILN